MSAPACGAGGVDDGTRMRSALRSHRRLPSALLSSFAISFFTGGGRSRGGGRNLTRWGRRAEGSGN